jgi:hypothetical protein
VLSAQENAVKYRFIHRDFPASQIAVADSVKQSFHTASSFIQSPPVRYTPINHNLFPARRAKHETDAMDFIGPVLLAFICDYFPEYTEKEAETAELFGDIRHYIRDNEPYWVKEKAIDVIHLILLTVSMIKRRGDPSALRKSPRACIDEILAASRVRIKRRMKGKRPDRDGKFHFEIAPPESL